MKAKRDKIASRFASFYIYSFLNISVDLSHCPDEVEEFV